MLSLLVQPLTSINALMATNTRTRIRAALLFAGFASLFENLIEFVNIIGSLFYGTILGIFLLAFFFKRVGSRATLIAAIIGEILVVTIFMLDRYDIVNIAYLWLNLIGCVAVILIGMLLAGLDKSIKSPAT